MYSFMLGSLRPINYFHCGVGYIGVAEPRTPTYILRVLVSCFIIISPRCRQDKMAILVVGVLIVYDTCRTVVNR